MGTSWQLLTNWHDVTSQKIRTFINIALRTSNLTPYLLFTWNCLSSTQLWSKYHHNEPALGLAPWGLAVVAVKGKGKIVLHAVKVWAAPFILDHYHIACRVLGLMTCSGSTNILSFLRHCPWLHFPHGDSLSLFIGWRLYPCIFVSLNFLYNWVNFKFW